MKKILSIFLILLLLTGCAQDKKAEKLLIVTTLFPQYDFCRQIIGDKAEVILLLPPGMESHNYEPGVGDIKKITESDLFIYTGASMEPWAESIIEAVDYKGKTVDTSDNINLCTHEHIDHHHENDPHIWTSPKKAKAMVKNILNALCTVDAENSGYYRENAEKYLVELDSLHNEFLILSEQCKEITLCHGGKFAMTYLESDYGIRFLPAYDSCGANQEPSAMRVKEIIEKIKTQNLKGVFFEELSSGKIAETISIEADVPVYLLHTCHNLSKEEFEKGETYLSLMKSNIENIKKVIKDA